METVDVDLTELTAAVASLAQAADTWSRLAEPDLVASIKRLSATVLRETELLFDEEEEGELKEPKPRGGSQHKSSRPKPRR